MLYGGTNNIANAQLQYKKAYSDLCKKTNSDRHAHPAVLTEGGEQAKNSMDDTKQVISCFI